MNKKEFDDALLRLKQSPIYAMSLCSKELFHSNFWAWLIRQDDYRDFLKCFFKNFDVKKFNRVEREDDNRDLVIYDVEGKEYVIENKIKSYANYDQLVRYSESIEQGVVTGINEPCFTPPVKWSPVTYKEIAKELELLVEKNKDSRNYLIVKEYCNVLRDIQTVLDYCFNENVVVGKLNFSTEAVKQLGNKEIRLLDVYKKCKADDFIRNCKNLGYKEGLQDDLVDKKVKFWIERSFHNSKATISFSFWFYILNEEGKEEWTKGIGVQIEEYQFRLFIHNREKSISEIESNGLDISWFENVSGNKKEKTVRGHRTKMSDSKCKYGSHFVYQYFDINDDENDFRDYCCLERMIKTELDKAYQLIKDNKFN